MAYFVTGATGFLGRFLLVELLQREGTIYCLCRAQSMDKLDELKARLGDDDDRIVPIVGELGKERLGVEDKDVERIAKKVDSEGAGWISYFTGNAKVCSILRSTSERANGYE